MEAGIEEEGGDDLKSGQSIHPGSRISRLNTVRWNLNSHLMSCPAEMSPFMIIHSVCSVWFFRTWNPDAHWLWNLFPWTLFWVQLHHSGSSPFSLCILPWAYFFGWGQAHQCRHFPLLCDFVYICLRLCLQGDRGILGFFLFLFKKLIPPNGGLEALSPNTLWTCFLLQCVKP